MAERVFLGRDREEQSGDYGRFGVLPGEFNFYVH